MGVPDQRHHQRRPVQSDFCRRPDQPFDHQRTARQLHSAQRLRFAGLDPAGYNGQQQVLDYVDYQNISPNDSYGSFPDGQSFNRQEFFQATPGAANNGTATPPASFIDYTSPGSIYTQNFDSLPDPGATSVNSANPVTINGITYSLANPYDFAFPLLPAAAAAGWASPLWPAGMARVSWFPGSARPTATRPRGARSVSVRPNSSNRALGLLATSTTGGTAFGVRFINGTSLTLNRMNLQFTGEVWRQSNLPKTLQFYYFIDPTGTNTFPSTATAFLPALNVNFPTVAADTGGVAVDGTSPLNQTNLSVLNQTITNWPPGAALVAGVADDRFHRQSPGPGH